jgi:predicted RNA methylase
MGTQGQPSDQQRALGAWYSPPAAVDQLLDAVLEPVLDRLNIDSTTWADESSPALRILDPTCGAGNFLVGARQRLERRGLGRASAERCLIGVDIDADALAAASHALPDATFVLADAFDWEPAESERPGDQASPAIDVIIGNPPFVTPLRRHGTFRRGVADAAVLMLERCARWAPVGGLIMPLSVLATEHAHGARDMLARRLEGLWWHDGPVFDVAIDTCSLWWGRGDTGTSDSMIHRLHGPAAMPVMPWRGRLDSSAWSTLIADLAGLPPLPSWLATDDGPVLGDHAVVTADYRDEYYGLVQAVREATPDEVAPLRLITVGSMRSGSTSWGQSVTRFAKQRWLRPVVDTTLLDERMRAWVDTRAVPKVLVGGQSAVLRTVSDPTGELVGSVPVMYVIANEVGDLDRLAAALSSPWASLWAAHQSLGAGRAARAIRLRPRQLAALPLVVGTAPVDEAVSAWFRTASVGRRQRAALRAVR